MVKKFLQNNYANNDHNNDSNRVNYLISMLEESVNEDQDFLYHPIFDLINLIVNKIDYDKACILLKYIEDGHANNKEFNCYEQKNSFNFIYSDFPKQIRKLVLKEKLELNSFCLPILTSIWHPMSLYKGINNIGKNIRKSNTGNEFKLSDTNHSIKYIYPLGILLVSNGNHSIFVSKLKNELKVIVDEIHDISMLFEFLNYDGECLIDSRNNNKIDVSFEIGLLFEIGRILIKNKSLFPEIIQSVLK